MYFYIGLRTFIYGFQEAYRETNLWKWWCFWENDEKS